LVIFAVVRSGRATVVPFAVGAYIGGAYFFTSSTSFANPAVTLARTLSDTFAGIDPSSVPAFIAAQCVGAGLAIGLGRFLYPTIAASASAVVMPHPSGRRWRHDPFRIDLSQRRTVSETEARQLEDHVRVEGKATDGRPVVLFLCVHNAGRSQMARGWFEHLAGDRAITRSGGSEPANAVNPAAVAAMAEIGIDISEAVPKRWTTEVVQAADVVVTMGCGDACPLLPGRRYEDWVLTDPFGKSVEEVRPVRDDIGRRVQALLASLGVAPDPGRAVPMSDGPTRPTAADREMVQEAVREHYAASALSVAADESASGCCGVSGSIGSSCYEGGDLEGLPAAAVAASIGCANPVALADLAEGEVVLDLGSGGGIDVLLSARRVGPAGKAYGLDMTDEMLDLARRNQSEAGAENVEFLKGHMEAIPLPDASVDVVLSNCVIALSVDKQAVFGEAFRVLRPGGRLALADVVAEHEPDPDAAVDPASWVDCISGALTERHYLAVLAMAGFAESSIEFSHAVDPGFSSVMVRAVRPGAEAT